MILILSFVMMGSMASPKIIFNGVARTSGVAKDFLNTTSIENGGQFTAAPDSLVTASRLLTGTVSEVEIRGLLFMLEEEKMARDIYAYLFAKYGIMVFGNITKSENVHVSAIYRLIEGFKIADNSNNNPGEFTNPQISKLYRELIEKANNSVIDALKVGVIIEQTDIADLEKELSVAENSHVKIVYTNLLKASGNHLEAFTHNLAVRGEVKP